MGFVKSAAITFFSNLFLLGLSIISTTVIARMLGTNGKGVVDVANNFLTFATLILGLGIASANVFFLGRKKESLNEVFGNNILLSLLSLVLLVPFYFLNAHYHFPFLHGVTNFQILVVLIAVPIVNFKAAMINVLLGLQDFIEYNRLNIIDKVSSLLLLISFLFWHKTPTAVLMSTFIGAILVTAWEMYIIFGRLRVRPHFDLGLMRGMLGYGLKAQVGNIIQRLNYRLDVFIVTSFLPIGQVGIYGLAVNLGETLWGVTRSVSTVILPIASAAGDKKEMFTFTNQVTRISFALITLFSLTLALISKPLIILVFGPGFVASSVALLWLLPGVAIFSVSNILANYLAGVGLVEKNIYSSIVSAIITIVLDFWLIPRIGINGASIATSLSYITFTSMTLFFYSRYTGSSWPEVLLIKGKDIALIKVAVQKKLHRK